MTEERLERAGLVKRLGISGEGVPWPIGEALLAPTVLVTSTIFLGTAITATLTGGSVNPPVAALLVGWVAGLAIATLFMLVRWRSTTERFAALKLGASHWSPLLALLVGIGFAFTADLIAGLGSGSFNAAAPLVGLDNRDAGQLLLAALLVMIAAPVAEGLAFGGILLPRLRETFGAWPGLIATAALYALYYYMVFGAQLPAATAIWYGLIAPLVLAFGLLAVRIWSGSTRAMIMAQVGAGQSMMLVLWLA